MIERTVGVEGGVVYWAAGPTRREVLESYLQGIGLSDHMPPMRTEAAALREALGEVCAAKKTRDVDYIVQSHKNPGKHGFDVVAVRRDTDCNGYSVRYGVKIDNGSVETTHGYCDDYQLAQLYAELRGMLGGSSISSFLVKMLGLLGGVTLRENGGIYWLSSSSLPLWEKVTSVVEQSAVENGKNRCYLLRTLMDHGTARAVKDAVTSEVEAAAIAIAEELASGELGEAAVENRKARAEMLLRRVEGYERILGEGLEKLRSTVENVSNSIAIAALQCV